MRAILVNDMKESEERISKIESEQQVYKMELFTSVTSFD